MRTITLKRIILIFSLIISLIIIAQVYWLNKLYSFEQGQFTTNVVKSIRGLFEDLALTDEPMVPLQDFIKKPDANTFVVKIDSIPPKDSLTYYLSAELEDFDVFAECYLAVYDKKQQRNVYNAYVPMSGSRDHSAVVNAVPKNMNSSFLLLNLTSCVKGQREPLQTFSFTIVRKYISCMNSTK